MLNADDLVTAKGAAELAGMGERNWHTLKPSVPVAAIIGGRKMYLRQDVIEWNRKRLAGLHRHWKRHKQWQDSMETGSPPPAA